MLARALASLSSTIPPEQRPAWARLARRVVQYLLILAAALLVLDLALGLFSPTGLTFRRTLAHLLAAAALGLSGLLGLRWIGMGRILAAGYLLAGTLFSLGLGSLALSSDHLSIASAAFGLSILMIGVIVGGGSVYLFAVASSFAVFASWAIGWLSGGAFAGLYQVLGQALIFVSAAVVLHLLSSYIQGSVATLHTQADRLTHLAQTDPLTGLANRRHFIEQLQREFGRARRYHRPLSLLYLDLDGFKAINDQFGHIFGDDVLKSAARSMQSVLRSTDLLARIGGDEFAVLLPETTLEGAEEVSRKLAKSLRAYSQQIGPAVPALTFCGGAAHLRADDGSIDALLARADEAQYLAKATGKAHTRTEREVEDLAETKPTRV